MTDNGSPPLSSAETFTVIVNEVNLAPVLAAIANTNVNEGLTLTLTATATDSDVPQQTLAYSLDPGAPAGAAITAGGVFTWSPTEAQGPATIFLTVRVTDNGSPPASAFETIQVTVQEVNLPPVLTGV
ncbi:MAG: hypothetical protein HY299_05705, partial [Verrucomicrobia bacterium]|nr:hypothetical protein [Verrucomicrobiota bacterium]